MNSVCALTFCSFTQSAESSVGEKPLRGLRVALSLLFSWKLFSESCSCSSLLR